MFRVPWFVPVDDSDGDDGGAAVLFCLHVLPEVEVEFEFGSKGVVVDELVPERLARTGRLAFGAGVGIETYESLNMSFCAPSRKLYRSLYTGGEKVPSNIYFFHHRSIKTKRRKNGQGDDDSRCYVQD